MKRSDLLQEIREIQSEMQKEWYEDISRKNHQFTVKKHCRYAALDNIASMLEAIEVEDMKEIAKLISAINKKNQIFKPRLCAF